MNLLREEDVVKAANDWLRNRVEKYRPTALFLPAGETPRALYADWRRERPACIKGLRLLQVDDVLDGPGRGQFARFFAEELPGFVVEPPLSRGAAELAILGFGTNGHVAFHEPYLPADFAFGEVSLEPGSCKRLGLAPGTKGISYGLGAFLATRAVLLLVKGEGKRDAWERFRRGDPSLPASGLLRHPDLSVWTDL